MKPLRQLFHYTRQLRGIMLIVAATSIIGSLLTLAVPFAIKFATDYVVSVQSGSQQFEATYILMIAGVLLVVSLLQAIISDVGGYFGDILAVRTRRQLSEKYYSHLMTLPQRYYDNEVTGKIINRLSRAITDVTNFINFFSNNLLEMMLTVVLVVSILAFYYWPLAVLVLMLLPIYLYLTAKTSEKWQAWEAKKNTHFDVASGRFAEVVAQMRLVKSFGAEEREVSAFKDRFKRIVAITRKQSRYWHTMNFYRVASQAIIYAMIFLLLFMQTANGTLSIGDMILIITLIQQVTGPLRGVSFFIDSYQRAVANSKDYLAAMKESPEKSETAKNELRVTKGYVQFREVTFAYQDTNHVVSDVTFEMKPGEIVALVGESGGGKSTVTNLLMQLYRPSRGSIQIDGQDLQSVTLSSVRGAIATVFQDAGLFSGTIRENIVYGKPQATDSEIQAALDAANASAFVNGLKDGIETEIGERGIKLSGGQKQRIAIARALLKDAPILILDEATSSLDSKAEAEVQTALDRLMKGRTVLIIAHRLSTIAHVDTIVTIKDGRIDEIGSPAELAGSGGIYSELLTLQTNTNENSKKALQAFDIVG